MGVGVGECTEKDGLFQITSFGQNLSVLFQTFASSKV